MTLIVHCGRKIVYIDLSSRIVVEDGVPDCVAVYTPMNDGVIYIKAPEEEIIKIGEAYKFGYKVCHIYRASIGRKFSEEKEKEL